MKDLLEQLQQLAPLAAAATAGPWEVIPNSEHTDSVHSTEANHTENFGLGDFRSSNLCMNTGGFAHDADAAFIAAARNLLTPENLTLLVAALAGMELESKLLEMLQAVEPYDYWSRGRAVGISEALTLVRNMKTALPNV